jgi:hypothetical protein
LWWYSPFSPPPSGDIIWKSWKWVPDDVFTST